MAEREVEPLSQDELFRVLIGDRELGFAEVTRLTSKSDRQEPEGVGTRSWSARFWSARFKGLTPALRQLRSRV